MANPNGAGRPIGSVQTPQSLLKAELKATAQTLAKVRAFIETQLKVIDRQLNNASLQERLAALDTITSVTEKLGRVMESAGKILTAKSPANEDSHPSGGADASKILEELMGGGKY